MTGDVTPPTRGVSRRPHMAVQQQLKMQEAHRVLRSRIQPPSKIPCQHKALVGKSAHPRIITDYVEAGVLQHIAAIWAWNRGHRMDYANTPLPSDKEAKLLTCSACGDKENDCSRRTRRIMGLGHDSYELAKSPMAAMRYHRMAAARELRIPE
jgi:hypothetical protein